MRNAATVVFARYYGLTVVTCVPADPATKGGSEAWVRVAKADLVPTETNLLDEYGCFAELEAALWLTEAGATGATRVRAKIAEAVQLARLHPAVVVDRALGQAATAGRFADGDLAAILTHQAQTTPGPPSLTGSSDVSVAGRDQQIPLAHVVRRSHRSRSGATPPTGRSPRPARGAPALRCPTPTATRCVATPPAPRW